MAHSTGGQVPPPEPSFGRLARSGRHLLTLVIVTGLSMSTPTTGTAFAQSEIDAASSPPTQFEDVGIEQKIGSEIPLDLAFTDSTGDPLQLRDLFGEEPVILVPVYYTCPMLCTLTLEGMARSLKVLGLEPAADYQLVAFSFDPTEGPDDAARKRAATLDLFGAERGAEGWHFLTGDTSAVRGLTEAIGFSYERDPESGEFVHAATAVVVTPDGEVARYLHGIEPAPKDLRLALVEASDGRVGSAVDQVLLYCFRYDPATGEYTLLTMRLLRAGAVVTLLGLGLLIGTFVYQEKKGRIDRADRAEGGR